MNMKQAVTAGESPAGFWAKSSGKTKEYYASALVSREVGSVTKKASQRMACFSLVREGSECQTVCVQEF